MDLNWIGDDNMIVYSKKHACKTTECSSCSNSYVQELTRVSLFCSSETSIDDEFIDHLLERGWHRTLSKDGNIEWLCPECHETANGSISPYYTGILQKTWRVTCKSCLRQKLFAEHWSKDQVLELLSAINWERTLGDDHNETWICNRCRK